MLRKAVAAALTIFVGCAFIGYGRAQLMMMTGAGKGSAGAAPYVGPGDVVSGATLWTGLRCYNAAYSGNVARIKSPSDALTTTITCSAGGVLGTTGTALATTCAVSCTVDILYDQSGASACGGPCDLIQPTEANRPVYTAACQGSFRCMTFTSAASTSINTGGSGAGFTQTNPYSFVTASRRDIPANFSPVLSVGGQDILSYFATAGNIRWLADGTNNVILAGTTEGAFDSIIGNTATSSTIAYINTSATTDSNATTGGNIGGSEFFMGGSGAAGFSDISVFEAGVWPQQISAGNSDLLMANMKSYWGY